MADTTKKTVTYEIAGDSTKLIRTIESAMRQIDALETKLSRVAIKKDVSPLPEDGVRDALERIASVTRAINDLEKTQATLESVDLSLLSEPQLQLIKVASTELKTLAKDMGTLRDAGKVSQEQLDKVAETTHKINQAIKDAGIVTVNYAAVSKAAAKQAAQEAKQAAQEYQTALRNIKNAISSVVGVLRTLVTAGYELMSEAADFGETMNKFNVVAGASSQVLGEFADRLAAAYGLDPKDMYEGVASFKSVANSINLADGAAEKFSKNLMSLSLDLSSLYNTSVDQAMNALVSGLHGQERAMKNYNVYLYEANIQQKAYDIGLKKSAQSMNEAEKVCLRYMVAMDQTKAAQGDLQRTLSSTANQMKIVQAQFAQLRRALGQIVSVIGMSVVPVINALLGGLVKVFTLIASKMGYEIENFANAFDANADATDGATKALEGYDATAAGLSGLDEINLITPAASTSGGMDLTGVDQSILDAMDKYQDLSGGIYGTFSDLADKVATTLENTLTATLFEGIVGGLTLIGDGAKYVIENWDKFEPLIKVLIDLITIFLALKVADTMKGWAASIGKVLGQFQKLNITLPSATTNFKGMVNAADASATSVSGLTIAVSALAFTAAQAVASSIFSSMDENSRRLIATMALMVSALIAATTAWVAYHGAMSYGTAVPIIAGAIGVGIASIKAMIPDVPAAATGGVVSQPTLAMVGEGKYDEAIVPLGNSPQFTAMKGEIADEVARKLSQTPYAPYGSTSRSSQANVILQVNGRELARALLPDLGITRPQTGVKLV